MESFHDEVLALLRIEITHDLFSKGLLNALLNDYYFILSFGNKIRIYVSLYTHKVRIMV